LKDPFAKHNYRNIIIRAINTQALKGGDSWYTTGTAIDMLG